MHRHRNISIDVDGGTNIDVEVDVDIDAYFGCLKASRSQWSYCLMVYKRSRYCF